MIYINYEDVLFWQLGGFYIWTHTYQLVRNSAKKYHGNIGDTKDVIKVGNKELDVHLLKVKGEDGEHGSTSSSDAVEEVEKQVLVSPLY